MFDRSGYLLSAIRNAGYNAKLIPVQVGSRGLPNMSGFENLRRELKLTKTQTHDLMAQAARKAMPGSFSIWCSRTARRATLGSFSIEI